MRMLPSVAYGFKACSDKYKRRPQEKFCRTWKPAVECWNTCAVCGESKHPEAIDHAFSRLKVLKYIGYNADEWHRVRTIVSPYYEFRYPLVELGVTKRMVREICLKHLGYVPYKSACSFCPSSKKSEVIWLANNLPEHFARAVAIERNADYEAYTVTVSCPECDGAGCNVCDDQGTWEEERDTTVVGLGRHWKWEDIVRADEQQFKLFPEAPEIACMCFDSGEEGGQ